MIDFPTTPAVGDTVTSPDGAATWGWDGTAWALVGEEGGGGDGGSGFTYSQDTPPTATAPGQTWFNTTTGFSYTWTDDGTSQQWVQFAPGGGGGGGGSGFTFVQEELPTPTQQGDTWLNLSTGPLGGVSMVAIDEGSGELVWVQFAPGAATPPTPSDFPSTAQAVLLPAWPFTGTFYFINLATSGHIASPVEDYTFTANKGRIGVTKPGLYLASINFGFNAAAANAAAYMHVYLEHWSAAEVGVATLELLEGTASLYGTVSGTMLFNMAAGDYVRATGSTTNSPNATSIRNGVLSLTRVG